MKKVSGSGILGGCQVGCLVLLIPWIFTAAMVELFPGIAYSLAGRSICPANSSIQVQGTKGWLFAVLSDDEAVEFPQFTCVDAGGTVLVRGDSTANLLAYLRVAGSFIVGFLAIGIAGSVLTWFNSRKRGVTG